MFFRLISPIVIYFSVIEYGYVVDFGVFQFSRLIWCVMISVKNLMISWRTWTTVKCCVLNLDKSDKKFICKIMINLVMHACVVANTCQWSGMMGKMFFFY